MKTNKRIQVLFAGIAILVMLSGAGCGRGYSTEKYLIWRIVKTPDGSEEVAFAGVADRWSMKTFDEDILCLGAECLRKDRTILADSGKSSGLIAIQYPPAERAGQTEAQWVCKPLFPYFWRFSLATLIGRISTCYKADRNGKVISEPIDVIAAEPMDAEAYCERGAGYSENGWYDRAISDYNKAIKVNPKFAQAFYNRGLAYYRKGQHHLAIADYARAIEINPKLHDQDDVLIRMIREKWANHKAS